MSTNKEYVEFVNSKLSNESSDIEALIERLRELHKTVNVPELLTASSGLASEGGEFAEIAKKMAFQGKPPTEENLFHMKRELGDIAFYLAVACLALDISLDDVLEENRVKLDARYKNGFTVDQSENRVEGDL